MIRAHREDEWNNDSWHVSNLIGRAGAPPGALLSNQLSREKWPSASPRSFSKAFSVLLPPWGNLMESISRAVRSSNLYLLQWAVIAGRWARCSPLPMWPQPHWSLSVVGRSNLCPSEQARATYYSSHRLPIIMHPLATLPPWPLTLKHKHCVPCSTHWPARGHFMASDILVCSQWKGSYLCFSVGCDTVIS